MTGYVRSADAQGHHRGEGCGEVPTEASWSVEVIADVGLREEAGGGAGCRFAGLH
jgi:hypothetical protein